MLVWVEVKRVGRNVSDQLPSLSTVAVPRFVAPLELRSPKIHTSTESIAPAPALGSVAVPVIVYERPPEAETFEPSTGLPIESSGGAVGFAGAGAGGGGAGAGAGCGAGAGAGAAGAGAEGACATSSSFGRVPLMAPLGVSAA